MRYVCNITFCTLSLKRKLIFEKYRNKNIFINLSKSSQNTRNKTEAVTKTIYVRLFEKLILLQNIWHVPI